MDLVHHSALDAGDVCQESARLDEVLVLFDPGQEHVRIQGEHDDVETRNIIARDLDGPAVDDALREGKVERFLRPRDGAHLESGLFQAFRVAAANQSQTDYKYPCVLTKHQSSSPVKVSLL